MPSDIILIGPQGAGNAGHSVYADPHLFQRVKQALAPYPNVVLLLPSPDLEESLRILNERNRELSDDIRSTNAHFVRHPSNYELAKITVYTKDKTPDETCEQVLGAISRP